MRRKDREVTELTEMLSIIDECRVIRIATQDEEGLYIIPFNFGYEYKEGRLYFYLHSAKEGRKTGAFRKDIRVAFEMDGAYRLMEGKKPCEYGNAYQSVMGNGKIYEISGREEKEKALSLLMDHVAGKAFSFEDAELSSVILYRVEADSFTAKKNG